jgi:hypothetical protein
VDLCLIMVARESGGIGRRARLRMRFWHPARLRTNTQDSVFTRVSLRSIAHYPAQFHGANRHHNSTKNHLGR